MTKIKDTYYIIFIAIIGFILMGSGVIFTFYYHWDNNYVLQNFILKDTPPTNWMGWFYPYLWDVLYRLTNTENIIGIFTSLLYWSSITTIYLNMFQNKSTKSNVLWFIVFAFNPFVFGQLNHITNNIILLSFILVAIAFYTIYKKTSKKIYIIIGLLFLMMSVLIRRDAIFLVVPIISYFIYLTCSKKILFSILGSLLILGFTLSFNSMVGRSIPNYNSKFDDNQIVYDMDRITIDTIGLVILFDLTLISAYKNELIIPDYALKPEFRGENRNKFLAILNKIGKPALLYDWGPLQDVVGPQLQSGTVWHSGLKINKEIILIYLQNIHWYLWVKINMLYGYLIPLVSFLVLSLFTLFRLNDKFFNESFKEYKSFLIILTIMGWIYSVVVILSSNSVQYRYVTPPIMILWIVSIYIYHKIYSNYKKNITWELKERS